MPSQHDEIISLDCPRCGAPLQMQGDLLTCQHCGAKLILKRSAVGAGDRPSTASTSIIVNGIALNPFAYHDPQSGLEAFSILAPQGWQVSGGVTWVMDRPAAPVQFSFQIANPNGIECYEVLPTLYFTWTNDLMAQMSMPVGSLYFGYQVCQPITARDVMRQLVLPRYRRIQGLSIVAEGPAPELQQFVTHSQPNPGQGGQYSIDSARVRLHYALNQQPVAEDISGVAEYTRVSMPGFLSNTESVYWNMGYLSCFRSEPKRLDNYGDLYRTLFTSVKLNPAWLAVVQQVSQGLTSNTIRNINQIGEISRQISRTFNEMSDRNIRGWEQRSAARDWAIENVSRSLRGGSLYYDPNTGNNVELPTGYSQAWSTPLGEYILSDDPNFNPNVGSNQTWTMLTTPKE